MTSARLFVELLHRLRDFHEAMVLHAVMQEHADVSEFKTSAAKISLNLLSGQADRKQVQRAIARLEDKGLVQSRSNYRAFISVDRDAVESLLRIPVSNFLPGLRTEGFPFLDYLNAKAEEQAKNETDSVLKRLSQNQDQLGPEGAGDDN